MALDFQQVREQVTELGKNAAPQAQQARALRDRVMELLEEQANEIDRLRAKVQQVVDGYERSLRCALPVSEPLNASFPAPELPEEATVVAVDGSQIFPQREAQVSYALINIGAIWARMGTPEAPCPQVQSQLLYGDQLYTPTGRLTEELLTLQRDLKERSLLVDLVSPLPQPVITFTDGPMELWGAKDSGGDSDFSESLNEYLHSLSQLAEMQVTTAGYVDKPGANLVVRLLEVATAPANELEQIRIYHPFREVSDIDLYSKLLKPGERSAIFAMQSLSAKQYQGPLGLHFFYLNVGRTNKPWLARVEIPAWVAERPTMLNQLHAVLVHQCRIMGARPYPYLLHRAHETAVVSMEEKDQVTQMIAIELRRQGVEVSDESYKQANKALGKRTSYSTK